MCFVFGTIHPVKRAKDIFRYPQINSEVKPGLGVRGTKRKFPAPGLKTNFMYRKIRNKVQKKILVVAAIFFTAASAFAQGNGMAGINDATSMVSGYFDPITKLIYAIGAVLGLVGGVKVYSKFQSGDPDTSKTAASWFGGCIFLIVTATILRSFFL